MHRRAELSALFRRVLDRYAAPMPADWVPTVEELDETTPDALRLRRPARRTK
jgi:hypothetical protein